MHQDEIDNSLRYNRPMIPSRCPLHRDATAQLIFHARDPVTGDHFDVVSCGECGLARTDPQPDEAELDRYYPASYHVTAERYRFGLERTLGVVHARRIRRIERILNGNGRVLDIGCGPGWFIDAMRKRGWSVRGTERSVAAAQHARDVLHLEVGDEDVEELLASGERFDAVVLWHVAEHLRDPLASLRAIAGLLRPGGVLMIGVPNFGSIEARIGQAGWFHLDVPRHLFHFTPRALEQFLVEAGLDPRLRADSAPEYDVFSFVQTAQNALGVPQNLLYDVLRRREARLSARGMHTAVVALALALAVPLTLIGVVWAPVAAALGRGATITIYATRPLEAADD